MRPLTDRQVAILATVERLGEPTLLDIANETALKPSEILDVLTALEKRGLIAFSGHIGMVYSGQSAPPGIETSPDDRGVSGCRSLYISRQVFRQAGRRPQTPSDSVVRFRRVEPT